MARKKYATEETKAIYVVVVAEYDESGSDGLAVDNALVFNDVPSVVDFITGDYEDTLINAFGDGDDTPEPLSDAEVANAVKRIKVDGCCEWDTPSDSQVWVKWKVFRKA